MNIQIEEVPCPCPMCRLNPNSLHRLRRMWLDDKPVSPEVKAMLDEIVKDAIRASSQANGSKS